MLIKSTNLVDARLMDFFQVMSIVNDFLKKEDLEALKLTEHVTAFEAAFTAMDEVVKEGRKTGYTDQIIAADDARDALLTGFFGVVRHLVYAPDEARSAAAAAVEEVIRKYGVGIQELPQREQTATLTNLVQDLRTEEMKPLVEASDLTYWVDELDLANREFDELYKVRTEREAELVTGITRIRRSEMQEAFRSLCRAIDSFAFLEGEEKYLPLAEKINTEVAKVQQAMKARSTLAKGRREETDQ